MGEWEGVGAVNGGVGGVNGEWEGVGEGEVVLLETMQSSHDHHMTYLSLHLFPPLPLLV